MKFRFRCQIRRNGQKGLGRITIDGRSIILNKLLDAQRISNINLISDDEINRIKELWEVDLQSTKYFE
jgi:DNA sulfur modification protein DndC